MEKEKRFVIIDANSLIHRAFHALPPLTSKDGVLANAVFGFFSIFLKAVKDLQPDFMAAAFDAANPTFRHLEFERYKAKRKRSPQELYDQIERIKTLLADFSVPVFEKEGFEADDVIGSLADFAKKISHNLEIFILSSDKDFLQLIDEKVKVVILKRGMSEVFFYDQSKVEKEYGFAPISLIDFKALRGDPADNIPGAKGIGEKTALKLIKEFKDINNIYKLIKENLFLDKKLQEKLLEEKKMVFLSRRLVEIKNNIPFCFGLEDCACKNRDYNKVSESLRNLGFKSLLDRWRDFC